MARYIEVEYAIYRLHKMATIDGQPRAIRRAARYLEQYADEVNLDVQEVKHGKWVNRHNKTACNLCGEVNFLMPNYCPNCGAKMDGKENER